MKTVLAPNAPWPVWGEDGQVIKPKPVLKPRQLPPPKDPSKIAHTDAKYKEWAQKNGVKR